MQNFSCRKIDGFGQIAVSLLFREPCSQHQRGVRTAVFADNLSGNIVGRALTYFCAAPQ